MKTFPIFCKLEELLLVDFFLIVFQLVSFMLDLQGEPKGLSIGGLIVISTSTSLTVKPVSY